MSEEEFIVNRLRKKPVEYSIRLSHFVSGGVWQMGVSVHDVPEDQITRERVAADLRAAADMLEGEKQIDTEDKVVSLNRAASANESVAIPTHSCPDCGTGLIITITRMPLPYSPEKEFS